MSKEKKIKPAIKEFEKFELPQEQQNAVIGGGGNRPQASTVSSKPPVRK